MVDGWMHGYMHDGWVDESRYVCMDACMMDGWMDVSICIHLCMHFLYTMTPNRMNQQIVHITEEYKTRTEHGIQYSLKTRREC